MKIRKLLIVSLLCLMAGCSEQVEEEQSNVVVTKPVQEGEYSIVIPFEESDATQTHVTFNRSGYDVQAAGEGLMDLSKQYFPTDTYYLQDGQLLDRDTLQVNTYYGDSEGLLGFKSESNTYGLNPAKDSNLPTSEGESIVVSSNTIPVVDIFEYNFMLESHADAQIEGISFAIVLNPNVLDAEGNEHVISDENLQILGEEAARNVVSFVKDLPQVSNNTPIMVALFKADSSDSVLPGSFFAVGYGNENIDQFHTVDEVYALFPSTNAQQYDPGVSAQFDAFSQSLSMFLPNDISVIGEGLFIDKKLDTLSIEIKTQGKTYIENQALIQYVQSLLVNFTSDEYAIQVSFISNVDTYALMSRSKNSSDAIVIMK